MNKTVAPSYPTSLKLFVDALDGSYSGSGTTVIDKIGTQNGVMVNGVTWNATDGFVFDGTNDLITFANNSAIKPTTKGSISVMCKFLNPYTGIVVSTMETNTYRKGVSIFQDGSPVRGYISNNSTSQSFSYSTHFDNVWKMLTLTWDGTIVKRYVNDAQLGIDIVQLVSPTSNTSPVTIGDLSPTDYPFKGNVSWLKIYDDVITLSDVQANFNSIKTRHGL